jgi:hypothetical protein
MSKRFDKTGANTKKFKEFFGKMSDSDFTKWANKFFKDDDENFYFEILPYKNEPLLEDLKECGDYLNCPLDEYVYMKHDGNKDHPIRSAHKVPVGWMECRRLQQMLLKKNSYSLDISMRNQKTNQLTGDDKIARLTDQENYVLHLWEADAAMEELMGPRADDSVGKMQLYKQISLQGYAKQSDIETDVGNKQTLNTVDTFFMGAGLMTDLVTPSLLLKRTEDNKNRRKTTQEKNKSYD